MVKYLRSRWIPISFVACMVALGCAGTKGGEEGKLAERTTDAEVVVLSFGGVQGELLECG
ncbi:MAG: hypothetical protein KDA27_17475 [Candidatus Eisenbacteria bacterium]|uniref:Uncharacterized protein n=1 Tax=Eiseniibacteriota bacterium TaxID=2212470 RepID=A0A956NDV2_UNCEI|nr:hypothetical protein [Candidatus Eisenbacteria bacterium]MCB9463099.1 hypothetical protein [Candidatus Eisenbacteria bacterium]